MEVPRWYCRDAHRTFSLLPDCMSARLTGSLDEAEQVVVKVEESRSVEAAAKKLRPEIEVAGAVRWVRRRLQGVRDSLLILLTLLPDRLGTKARLVEVRSILASERARLLGGVARDRRAASPRFASTARIPPGRNPNVEK